MAAEADLRRAGAALQGEQRLLLVCHRKPDGDALGATLGLGLALEAAGKSVRFACADPVPQHYRFLPAADRFSLEPHPESADLVVMLDCGADHLLGWPLDRLAGPPLLDID